MTRCCPDRADYVFEAPGGLEALVGRLAAARWRGELTGPHGAGKSTLMRALQREAERRGLRTGLVQCSGGARRPVMGWARLARGSDVWFVDGAELLTSAEWWMVAGMARALGRGLVITTHEARGFGTTVPVVASADALVRFVTGLSGDGRWALRVPALLERFGGNAREALFALYDEYEVAACGGS